MLLFAGRKADARSAARARQVQDALGWPALADAEIPAIWQLAGSQDGLHVDLAMSSPALGTGILSRIVDWMKLVAAWPDAGGPWELRPPRRTVSEWRDGHPGEAPTRTTPGGRRFVLIGTPMGGAATLARCDVLLDGLPEGAWLVGWSAGRLELRAAAPLTDDPVACARRLLVLAHEAATIARGETPVGT